LDGQSVATACVAIKLKTQKEFDMITAKSAKKKMKAVKAAAVDRMDHITTNEKIAGAAAIGVAIGVAATALGSSLLHGGETATKTAKTDKKAPAAKG
jgi:hypothetical protein